MSAINTNHPTREGGWTHLLTPLLTLLAQRRQDKLARQSLFALDDRGLKDIGLNRADIDRVVRQGRPS